MKVNKIIYNNINSFKRRYYSSVKRVCKLKKVKKDTIINVSSELKVLQIDNSEELLIVSKSEIGYMIEKVTDHPMLIEVGETIELNGVEYKKVMMWNIISKSKDVTMLGKKIPVFQVSENQYAVKCFIIGWISKENFENKFYIEDRLSKENKEVVFHKLWEYYNSKEEMNHFDLTQGKILYRSGWGKWKWLSYISNDILKKVQKNINEKKDIYENNKSNREIVFVY